MLCGFECALGRPRCQAAGSLVRRRETDSRSARHPRAARAGSLAQRAAISVSHSQKEADRMRRTSISGVALGLVLGVPLAATRRHRHQPTAGRPREGRGHQDVFVIWHLVQSVNGVAVRLDRSRRRSFRGFTSRRWQRERDHARHHALFHRRRYLRNYEGGTRVRPCPRGAAHSRPFTGHGSERCF